MQRTVEEFDVTEKQAEAFWDILVERRRQEDKWHEPPGSWPCAPGIKLAVLLEEVGEVANALLERDATNLRAELVQVAAVCLKWLEAYDASEVTNRVQDGTG